MWTQTDDLSSIENLCISSIFQDGTLMYFKVTPRAGYKIYTPGCKALMAEVDLPKRYDFKDNPNEYVAVEENFALPIKISPEEALEIIMGSKEN